MHVELSVTPLAAFPALDGAHKLAWHYILDTIFAEMYHAKVGQLHLTLPSEALVAEVRLRAELTPPLGEEVGVALLGAPLSLPADTKKVFTLTYGSLAPKALKASSVSPLENWQAGASLHVLTWQVKVFGLAMSLLNRWRAPHLADPAMFAMRTFFASPKPTPAYYHLQDWTP